MKEYIVELKSPVSEEKLIEKLDDDGLLQCSRKLNLSDLNELEKFLREKPDVILRIYKAIDSKWKFDISFVRKLPSLKRLFIEADAGDLNDFSALDVLPKSLKSLSVDTLAPYSNLSLDKAKKNLDTLKTIESLEELILCGRLGELTFLKSLAKLRSLELWRCRLKSLSGLEALDQLSALKLFSSGAKNLSAIASLIKLESLEIWNQRNMMDLSPLQNLKNLKKLYLISCGQKIPLISLEKLTNLRVCAIGKLTQCSEIELIASAPALRCLILDASKELHKVESFSALANHPSLEELRLNSDNATLMTKISNKYGWKVSYSNYPAEKYL